jgi:hypothetical protein
VLEGLARALRLDDAERAHLFDLARAAKPTSARRRRRAHGQRVRASVQHLLDGLTGAAALVHNARLDNLAANQLGYALYSDLFAAARGPGPVNSARYVFLEPSARDFYVDWDRAASDVAAVLRSAAARDPYDRGLSDLVGELSTQSEPFRSHWAAHNIRFHETGVKDFHHSSVGDLTLTYNRMELSADPGLTIMAYRRARFQVRGSARSARQLGRHGRARGRRPHGCSRLTGRSRPLGVLTIPGSTGTPTFARSALWWCPCLRRRS